MVIQSSNKPKIDIVFLRLHPISSSGHKKHHSHNNSHNDLTEIIYVCHGHVDAFTDSRGRSFPRIFIFTVLFEKIWCLYTLTPIASDCEKSGAESNPDKALQCNGCKLGDAPTDNQARISHGSENSDGSTSTALSSDSGAGGMPQFNNVVR